MEEFTQQEERTIRVYFLTGVLLKGAISAAEIIVGTLALLVPVTYVSGKIVQLADHLQTIHRIALVAPPLMHMAGQLAAVSSFFIALYLISRGLIKLLLIIALLLDQLWAYPFSLVALGGFVCYQCYQIIVSHSGVIVALTIFDLVVMWLIWEEYRVLRSHRAATAPGAADTL